MLRLRGDQAPHFSPVQVWLCLALSEAGDGLLETRLANLTSTHNLCTTLWPGMRNRSIRSTSQSRNTAILTKTQSASNKECTGGRVLVGGRIS